MSDAAKPQQGGASGCLLAVVIGVITVLVVNGGFSLITGADLDLGEEWGVFAFQTVLASAPFGLLALAGVQGRLPWLVGLTLTLICWGGYFFDALTSHGDGTGANVGWGLLMLLSPLIVTAGAFITEMARDRS